jgi:hypothetical protein
VKIYYYIQQGAIPAPTNPEPTDSPTQDVSIPIPLPNTTGSPLPTSSPTEEPEETP